MPGPFGNMQRMMQWFNPKNFMQQVGQFRSQFQQNADPQKIVMEQDFEMPEITQNPADSWWAWVILLLAIFVCGEDGWGKNLTNIDAAESTAEENRPG